MNRFILLIAEQAIPTTAVNRTVGLIVWIGLLVLTAAFLALSWTRLGAARPLAKCLTLSVFAHVLLAIFFYGTQMLGLEMELGGEQPVTISLITETIKPADEIEPDTLAENFVESQQPEIFDQFPIEQSEAKPPTELTDLVEEVISPVAEESPAEEVEVIDTGDLTSNDPADKTLQVQQSVPDSLNQPESEEVASVEIEESIATPAEEISGDTTPPIESPIAKEVTSDLPEEDVQQATAVEQTSVVSDSTPETLSNADRPVQIPSKLDGSALPDLYQARFGPSLTTVAGTSEVRGAAFGATLESEAAVQAGIEWLVRSQQESGRWNASEFGAGVDREVDGQQRGATGANADTGVSGLALLALMGDGHTHLSGKHRVSVQHGLEYILSQQGSDGSLAGSASLFARMYCHAMATIAVCEAYAMTGDGRLRDYAERAIGYTIRSQDRQTGGWRYQPADSGDMSQFGWQVLALRSAQQSGLIVPGNTRDLMGRFLASCNTGARGGLAAYRPGFGATRTMTAESLACRMWLDVHRSPEQIKEAADYIVLQLPNRARPDLYYWYYGSLSLRQVGGPAWEFWSGALKQVIPSLQLSDGSWAADTKWGGYGGKVYSTAMAVLCLESFYRYQ